jgi:hypothetical protein
VLCSETQNSRCHQKKSARPFEDRLSRAVPDGAVLYTLDAVMKNPWLPVSWVGDARYECGLRRLKAVLAVG